MPGRGIAAWIAAAIVLQGTAWAQGPPTFARRWGTRGSGPGQFSTPLGLAAGPQGDLFVVDVDNHRFQKFTAEGEFLGAWGTFGTGPGQFDQPSGVAVGPSGDIFVTDSGNRRIQRFASDGRFLGSWAARTADGTLHSPGLLAASASAVYVLLGDTICKFTSGGTRVTEWGSTGSGDGQFNGAGGVALDSAGNVYVTDGGNDRIQKFTSGGAFLESWRLGPGNSAGGPFGIALDGAGFVYVSFSTRHQLGKYTPTGEPLHAWGSRGNGNGQFDLPTGIAVDALGAIYVVDSGNDRIQKFSQTVAVQPLGWTGVRALFR